LKKGYSQWKIASELGVSLTTVYQWLTGYTLTARPETIERLKKFLSTHAYKAFAAMPMQASSAREPFAHRTGFLKSG
jgi:predicted transcriptional regulator